jgi:hypothetical protein
MVIISVLFSVLLWLGERENLNASGIFEPFFIVK